MRTAETNAVDLLALFSEGLDDPVIAAESLGGGRNSQVYRLVCQRSHRYVAKRYFSPAGEARNRLEVEFSSLQFLWRHGIRCVPRPILANRAQEYAVCEYIEGRTISSKEVTDADLDEAVRFLERLKALRASPESLDLPPASEACFSVDALVNVIDRRLERLRALGQEEVLAQGLQDFLVSEFVPSFHQIVLWCKTVLRESGLSFSAEIAVNERTLSPSDFGFHNALRRRDGHLCFLDFEYFWWDDPAKMIADVLLHPAMELQERDRHWFATQMFRVFQDHERLAKRLEVLWPLCGLNWCLIFLNEFVPEHRLRRGFAGGQLLSGTKVLAEQLVKAKQMLHTILGRYEHFP